MLEEEPPRTRPQAPASRRKRNEVLARTYVVVFGLATACGFPKPGDVGDEDFTVMLAAPRIRVVEGASATVGVKLSRSVAPSVVTVTVTGLPSGVAADPLTITSDEGTLTLHAATDAPQGDASLTITVSGADHSHDSPLSLLTMGPPGTLDRSFGSAGTLATAPAGRGDAIVIQPDGKVLVGGSVITAVETDYMVARYLANGAIDDTFSNGMKSSMRFWTAAQQLRCSLMAS